MLKKRVFILFFSLFLFNLNAESKNSLLNAELLEDSYTNSSKQLFSHGVIIKEDITTPITIYRVKNKFNFYDFSIKIEDDIYKSSSKEFDELSNKNSKRVIGENTFFDTLPLDILNYGLRNREYTLIEKAITFKYKGLETNKILITQKEIIEEPEEIILIEESTFIDDSLTTEEFTSTDEIMIIEEATTTDKTTSSEESNSTVESTLSSDDIGADSKNNETVVSVKPTFKPAKYKKLIYYQAKDTNQILRKEFYFDKTDRNPEYIVETNGINFINGYYIEIEYSITNFKTDQTYIFKYNTETMLYNKEKITNEFKDMTNFYGVK